MKTLNKSIGKMNALIAEFMELETADQYWQGDYTKEYLSNGMWYKSWKLMYHKRWDWLKPVLDKIHTYALAYPEQVRKITSMSIVVDIEPAYMHAIEFIEFLNKANAK